MPNRPWKMASSVPMRIFCIAHPSYAVFLKQSMIFHWLWDTAWRDRYADRTQHPEDDAEKVIIEEDWIRKINRQIPSEDAHGEYIGVAKFSASGAKMLRDHYQQVVSTYQGKPFRSAKTLQTAYLIELFQEMLEQEVSFHATPTAGDYMEIDTTEDLSVSPEILADLNHDL